MTGIRKSFGGVEVLRNVDFELFPGEVHVLAGENGAGKSTLMKILAGVFDDYRGDILLKGKSVRFTSPRKAREHGIAIIYQELSLVDSMTVAENLTLAARGRQRILIDRAARRRQARSALAQVGLSIDPDTPVEEHPLATRQLVEIARALSLNADVLIMDEPTSTLNSVEVEGLFATVRSLRERGCGVVYISHKLEEIFRIADRITVLRDGATVSTSPASDLPPEELIRRMVGREISGAFPRAESLPGGVALSVRHLCVPGPASRPAVDEVSFDLHESEVVGLAGLQGCGNSETLRALFGALGVEIRGDLVLRGRRIDLPAPVSAIRRGLVLQTNDRKSTGLVLEMSIRRNVTLASLQRFAPAGWLRTRAEREAARGRAEQLHLRYATLDQPVETLSGGNQQKVVFAKWLETSPRVLLLDDPTRGIDVGAKFEIYELIVQLKRQGCSILLVSSELPELLGLSDRVLVMREGKIVRELRREEATQENVLRAALVAEKGEQ
jgi:ribose transport system ATP-binding protein